MKTLLPLLVLAGALAGCQPQAAPADPSRPQSPIAESRYVDLPTSQGDGVTQALLEGILRGDADLGMAGCAWVEVPGLPESVTVLWPPGSRANFESDRFELVDEDGAIIAREGDEIALVGGALESAPDHPCPSPGQAWAAWKIE